MKVEFGEMKSLENGDGKIPSTGSFSVPSPFQWYKCREQFASQFDEKLSAFFFSHPNGVAENVAAFISKTEDFLGLTISFEKRTEFCKTNRPFALWVAPAPFWRECRMRRSLFTILLRCGFEYSIVENNYEHALYSVSYIKDTKLAVHRFLFGYTHFTQNSPAYSPSSGWRDFFRGHNPDLVLNSLGLPEKVKPQRLEQRTLLGVGAIWN